MSTVVTSLSTKLVLKKRVVVPVVDTVVAAAVVVKVAAVDVVTLSVRAVINFLGKRR